MARKPDVPIGPSLDDEGHDPPPLSEAEAREQFRLAMRCMAATVTIISTKRAGGQFGMTATSVVSVSMEPPSLLVCINRRASIHQPLIEAKAFCVNILSENQAEHCSIFSGASSGSDRFLFGTWGEEVGLPYLDQAQANIFCVTDRQIDYGTHTIFIGRVHRARIAGHVSPLVYLNGGFLPFHSSDMLSWRSAQAGKQ